MRSTGTAPERPGRFTPTRAGIINLWDYRDEEFVFVDGWLVLRGPNGSGKTKALEVLFPFLLDGRIEPRRLNPFAGEDRTMKSNLLYRGQEVAHSYVWMEFRDGARFITIGIGLRAHRHADRVTRWHFVADGRIGVDISLLDADDRPVPRKDLIAQLGADAVRDSAAEYRTLVDERLFGLGPARYEQLLDLVLTLRKPQLAKDLNPAELSRTLQRGLRPLDDTLIVEAARSFDDMEAVARVLEGLVAADEACTTFLSVYSTYLRTHARAAADALSTRRDAVDARCAELDEARRRLVQASADAATATAVLNDAEAEPSRWRAQLESLRSSAAYQSHEQLVDLERHVQDLLEAVERARRTMTDDQEVERRRGDDATAAERAARDARSDADRKAGALVSDAEVAGIAWGPDDARPERLVERVAAAVSARRDDVREVRTRSARLLDADREHARAQDETRAAEEAIQAAEQLQAEADIAVSAARTDLREGVDAWAGTYRQALEHLDQDLAATLRGQLLDAVDQLGHGEGRPLPEVFSETTAGPLERRRTELANLRADRSQRSARRAELAGERDRIAAENDDAPPAPVTRTAARAGRRGAPLWRLVRFADDLAAGDAAGIEAALHAAGLLDAWLDPDGASTTTALLDAGPRNGDGFLRPLPPKQRPEGPTLADVLVAEEQDDVPASRIDAVLRSIALAEAVGDGVDARTAVSRVGGFAQGVGVGSAAKPSPEYIGATARAARRAARVAECERGLAALDEELSELDRVGQLLVELLEQVSAAGRALPPPTGLNAALRAAVQVGATLRARREQGDAATARLDQATAEQAAASSALRRATGERSLPADRVDEVDEAVGRFERSGFRLEAGYEKAARTGRTAQDAVDRQVEAVERLVRAESAHDEARHRHREKDEAYRTLKTSIGADAEEILSQVTQAQARIATAEAALAQARDAHSETGRAQASAQTRVELLNEQLATARTEALQDAERLRPYAHADLLGLLRCPTDLRWPAGHDHSATGLEPAVTALHEAVLRATSELTPTESSLKQSATRLTTALTELQAQLPATGLDHRPEWDTDDGVIVVRVADEQGYSPVAHFAERIHAERGDQERLLTDAEQRVLEDALLGQLARQIHQRTIEARDLVHDMDTQMRARRMSSGLTVGVGWHLSDDLDAGQRDVSGLMQRDPARLGPAELSVMRRHFAGRIKAARAQSPEQPYRDLLAEVLDYRQWRVFAFTLHRPGGRAEPLTRAKHSQLSGGEQSVSLHLPLFAAANALFDSARPDAPRLLGLDEAFAGVDDNGRGELMSLAKQFGLDLFMTGYDLWVAHPSVSGAAHYDLSHSAVDHSVSTVLLVWDGAGNIADFDGTLARSLGSPQVRRVPAPGDDSGELDPRDELDLSGRLGLPDALDLTDE